METTETAIDRRITRTRAMLQNALISLILKEGYEAITINDICQCSPISTHTIPR